MFSFPSPLLSSFCSFFLPNYVPPIFYTSSHEDENSLFLCFSLSPFSSFSYTFALVPCALIQFWKCRKNCCSALPPPSPFLQLPPLVLNILLVLSFSFVVFCLSSFLSLPLLLSVHTQAYVLFTHTSIPPLLSYQCSFLAVIRVHYIYSPILWIIS